MAAAKRLVVSGGGIGGLTAAIALAADGHEVEVLEQAPALTAVGAGVTLAPNAMRACPFDTGLPAPVQPVWAVQSAK